MLISKKSLPTLVLLLGCITSSHQPIFGSGEIPSFYGTAYFVDGLPDFGPAQRLGLEGPRTASIPAIASGDGFEIMWGSVSTDLWLLHRRPDGTFDLRRLTPDHDDLGRLFVMVDLLLDDTSDAVTPLQLQVVPEDNVLLYRWSGASQTPGGVPLALPAIVSLGEPLKDFAVTLLDGSRLHIGELAGSIVVVNSWATWCIPCVEELPELNHLVKDFEGTSVQFVAVASHATSAELLDFLAKNQFSYEQSLASTSSQEVLGESYPRHVVLGRDGRVAFDQRGWSREIRETLAGIIRSLDP